MGFFIPEKALFYLYISSSIGKQEEAGKEKFFHFLRFVSFSLQFPLLFILAFLILLSTVI